MDAFGDASKPIIPGDWKPYFSATTLCSPEKSLGFDPWGFLNMRVFIPILDDLGVLP